MSENELQPLESERAILASSFGLHSVPAIQHRPRIILPSILFLTTVFTTLLAGIFMQFGFLRQTGVRIPMLQFSSLLEPEVWLMGVPFSVTLLTILMAHEMGHFLMCRHYGIDATYPYVLPAPPIFNPFGTFGAVIRIKSPFANSRQLFDIGIAGPIAGFVVLIPALIVGLKLSTIYQGRIVTGAYEFGEPLLFKWLSQFIFHGQDFQMNLHPVGFAAWFGMLATSLNLLPVGQLDGGHLVFALLGAKGHRWVSLGSVLFLLLISLAAFPMPGYLLFGIVLFLIGLKHPRPLDDNVPIGNGRIALGAAALAIFVVTFIMVPVRIL